MRTQFNIYTDGDMFAMPDYAGFVPGKGARVLMQGILYEVDDVSYEFQGSPIAIAHINVYLKVVNDN